MKIKEQECQVGKIATIHRGVLTEKLVIFTHLFAAATHTAQAHMYIHTYYRVHTWSSPSHGRQLQCRRGAAAAATIKEKR